MATVYLATDLKDGRRVALKVLKPELDAPLGATVPRVAEEGELDIFPRARMTRRHVVT